MGKGGQAEAGAEGKAFDPSLVGAFANACPGCADAACCAPAATPASGVPAADAPSASRFLGKFHGYFGFSMMPPSLERARNAPI